MPVVLESRSPDDSVVITLVSVWLVVVSVAVLL